MDVVFVFPITSLIKPSVFGDHMWLINQANLASRILVMLEHLRFGSKKSV
jgi:hypothetical protein